MSRLIRTYTFIIKTAKNFIQGDTNKVGQESGDPIFGDLNAKALRTFVQ